MAQLNQVSLQNIDKVPLWRSTAEILFLILLLAGFLRLYRLDISPPGLNQDEAANAWNAFCLLKTGKDQTGVSWPIFYTRSLGGNSSTLFMYFMIPFQAIGGLNIFTTRLPGAVSGILTVLLIYYVGKRLFDKQVGLMAAFLLALNPWHLQQSRWGHEATLGAFLGIAPLAMLLWARMPISDNKDGPPRPVLAAIAGTAAGICCYGYHSVRIFIPVFLLAIVLLTLPQWWNCIKTRKGALAIAAFIFGFAITFGPLAWQHIFYPEGISRHSLELKKVGFSLLDAPFGTVVINVLSRYIHHFGLDFLFIRGDHSINQAPPGCGQFHWYMLPIMILGLIFILKSFKSSLSARIVLALVIAYPVGDCFYLKPSMHALRSTPGLCGLVLLGAAGAIITAKWLWNRKRQIAWSAIAVFFAAVVVINARYFHRFYVEYNRNPEVCHIFNTDLIEACKWLKPRLKDINGVFCTTTQLNMPYIITLVALNYDPDQWFNEPREFFTRDEWDLCSNYGKMYFMYEESYIPALALLQQGFLPSRTLFIIRPGELHLGRPIYRIVNPEGIDTLWICER